MWLLTLMVPDDPANYGLKGGNCWVESPLTARSVLINTTAVDSSKFDL